jgi:predicted AlkP superfamily phosphohydrolase/phosphomutase
MTAAIRRPRLVAISIDASEVTRIEAWMAEGSLPVLRGLRERGAFARIESTADLLIGTPWATFLTGTLPPEHGWLFYQQWRPDLMRTIRTEPAWLPLEPFYRDFPSDGPRVIAIDVPLVYAPRPIHGVELTGWGTHDKLCAASSYPAGLGAEITRRFGGRPLTDEVAGPQSARELLQLRDAMIRAADWHADVGLHLMRTEPWDLFLLAFGSLHRAGHKLWDHTSVRGPVSESERAGLDDALRQVAIATDRALGRLLAALEPEVPVLVFALHGMTDNYSAFTVLPRMLERVLQGERRDDPPQPPAPGPLSRLREAVPVEWRSRVKSALPIAVQDGLTHFWATETRDWSRTRAFMLMGDLQALIQVNLRGRERDGIVEPGEAFERLLAEIADGLRSFVRLDTGAPVVKEIHRGDAVWPEAARRRQLPDLIVKTDEHSTLELPGVRSPQFGTIVNYERGHRADGRSGHHIGTGWLVAVGAGIPANADLPTVHELDLNATIHALLGIERPRQMRGRPVAALCPAAGAILDA